MAVEDNIDKSGDSSKKSIGTSSDLNLSFGDSLYLHPNDTGDDSNPALANQWAMCNFVVFTWILNSLSCELYAGAVYSKSAYEFWNDLKDTYDKVDGSTVFNLHKSINSLSQSGASLADYYNNLNSLWKQFDAMISLPLFLMGLDDSYLAIRSNILTRDPLPLVKPAFAIVSGEESHRNINYVRTTKPTATAFVAKTFDKKRFNSNNKGSSSNSNSNNRGPNTNPKCTNCNKIGHTVDRCFELVEYPAGYVKKNFIPNTRPVSSNITSADIHSNNASSSTTSNSPVSLSNEQLARLVNLLNDYEVSTANANMLGNIFLNIKGTFFNGSVKFNLNFKRYFNGNTLGWIVDSEANQHMTVYGKNLVNVIDFSNLGLTVGYPNGTQALITKIRDLKINNNITLYDVLVVPEYAVSLLSAHNLSRDSKLFVGFDESDCYIQDLKANNTVGIGRQFNGLYLFDVDNACKIVCNNIIDTCFVSKTLWHQRLGHPAYQVLDVLKTSP
ncbi:ribonuclease H-like domain-containing protein [Tanacetum coccineum]